MNKTILRLVAVVAVGLLILATYLLLPRRAARPPVQTAHVQNPPPAPLPRTGSKIFFFSPPEGFNDENLFWKNYHYIAHIGARGVERDGMIRVEGPVMNFAQSAYDPSTDTLYTWMKNYKPSIDYILRLSASDTRLNPVAAIPDNLPTPVLAVDSRRHRILVAAKEKFESAMGPLNFYLYDIGTGRWQSGRFPDTRFITLDYLERDDVFVGLGWKLQPGRTPYIALIRLDASGQEIGSVPVDLERALKRPMSSFSAQYALPNNPGIQSRVVDNTLVVMRYCDLGRPAVTAPFDWSYEVYHIDVDTGAMEFVCEFK